MLRRKSNQRLSIQQIRADPWFNNPKTFTLEALKDEFALRRSIIDTKNEVERVRIRDEISNHR